MTEKQLHWVQKNKAVRQPASRAGDIARNLIGSGRLSGPAWKQRLVRYLQEHAGPDLLDQAEPLTVRGGVLSFGVQEPAVLYHLRLQWEQRILQLVRSGLPEAGISAVRFVVHTPR